MRGQNIENIYCIDGHEYLLEQLNDTQLEYIRPIIQAKNASKPFKNIQLFAQFRLGLMMAHGDDIKAYIKIYFPEHSLAAYSPDGILLLDESSAILNEITIFNYPVGK